MLKQSVKVTVWPWIKENNTVHWFVFLILNIFLKFVPFLYLIFPVHEITYYKRTVILSTLSCTENSKE